jgi:hypothetical protein
MKKETIALSDLIDYDNKIKNVVAEKSSELILNDSIAHAAIVQRAILDKARMDQLPVDMYCGEFSIYQDKTKDKIENLVPEIKEKGDAAYHPYKLLLSSLKEFFEAGCRMNVILQKDLSGLSKQALWAYIEAPINQGLLRFYKLSTDFGLDHFTVSGNMYRRENSDTHKSAYCSFNSSDKAQVLKSAFDILSDSSHPTQVF